MWRVKALPRPITKTNRKADAFSRRGWWGWGEGDILAVGKDGEIKLQIAFLEQTGLKSQPSPPLLMTDDILSMQICIMERYVFCVISTACQLECVITLFKKGAT